MVVSNLFMTRVYMIFIFCPGPLQSQMVPPKCCVTIVVITTRLVQIALLDVAKIVFQYLCILVQNAFLFSYF